MSCGSRSVAKRNKNKVTTIIVDEDDIAATGSDEAEIREL